MKLNFIAIFLFISVNFYGQIFIGLKDRQILKEMLSLENKLQRSDSLYSRVYSNENNYSKKEISYGSRSFRFTLIEGTQIYYYFTFKAFNNMKCSGQTTVFSNPKGVGSSYKNICWPIKITIG